MYFKKVLCVVIVLIVIVVGVVQVDIIIIVIVNNGDMICMQGLIDDFIVKIGYIVEWVILEENVLCQCVIIDIIIKGGQFDIMIIGMYEILIWGENGWLVLLDDLLDDYDVDDILLVMVGGLSFDGILYVVLFYGESLMIMYCIDLMEVVGLEMLVVLIWIFICEVVVVMIDCDVDINGICLCGKVGWGEGGVFIIVMLNLFGVQWFDMDWNVIFDGEVWVNILNFFKGMMDESGLVGYVINGFNENLLLF